ncbi:hypothetical protein [Actinomyces minihominis]|uniref:hypothetical protein n=1 Tax=Actinomyces minihominis TaxID=2002838 RepID=UPI000C08AF5C|nr:hypothetical protein [Actinomyces minihominis]
MALALKGKEVSTARVINIVLTCITLVLLIVIIWIDVTSSVWQETVILSGVAAGFVTFLFTALFLERALARREHLKWAPVTLLALADILHTVADDKESDIHRGQVVARSLALPTSTDPGVLDDLLVNVVHERDEIAVTLSRWSQFLASSADVQVLMNHIADLAIHLDVVRDRTIEVERGESNLESLRDEVENYNQTTVKVIAEILSIQSQVQAEAA